MGGHYLCWWREYLADDAHLATSRCGPAASLGVQERDGPCGISAGAICWFQSGHSDSTSFYNPRKWKYINVRGLGLIRGIHCPHYNSETRGIPRRKQFRNMIQRIGGLGIAIENNCAIAFLDDRFYKVYSSKKHSRAYRVYRSGGKVIAKQIPQEKQATPIASLERRSEAHAGSDS